MRILMSMDSGGWSIPGGHRRQLLETARAISGSGVDVRAEPLSEAGLRWADIVHGFGLTTSQVRDARLAGCGVAVSTIYWGTTYAEQHPARVLAARTVGHARRAMAGEMDLSIALLTRRSRPVFRHASHQLSLALESADVLLPNAHGEALALRSELGVTTPSVVVPNAVDPSLFKHPGRAADAREGVICVARVEPHKNQLRLIRALAGTGLSLTIVGPPHPHHMQYFERCTSEASSNVTFTGRVSDDEIVSLLQRHRVHVLPSLFETTGLASLEAALCGCAVVTTERGWAREYFGEDAVYCSPWSTRSIRASVLGANDIGGSTTLADRIRECFTWQETAARTIGAYEALLETRRVNERP